MFSKRGDKSDETSRSIQLSYGPGLVLHWS